MYICSLPFLFIQHCITQVVGINENIILNDYKIFYSGDYKIAHMTTSFSKVVELFHCGVMVNNTAMNILAIKLYSIFRNISLRQSLSSEIIVCVAGVRPWIHAAKALAERCCCKTDPSIHDSASNELIIILKESLL